MAERDGLRIAVLTAMAEEGEALSDALRAGTRERSPGIPCIDGRMGNTEIVLVRTGIGKVAAAAAIQYVCDVKRPSCVLVTGIAGALYADASVGDLVVPIGAVQHDMDARPFFQRWVVPHLNVSVFEPHPRLANIAVSTCADYLRGAGAQSQVKRPGYGQTVRLVRGYVLSGDQVVMDQAVKRELVRNHPMATCVDMETAAVAQVAYQNLVPWVALRMISDTADETVSAQEVLEYCRTEGALVLRDLILEFVKRVSVLPTKEVFQDVPASE